MLPTSITSHISEHGCKDVLLSLYGTRAHSTNGSSVKAKKNKKVCVCIHIYIYKETQLEEIHFATVEVSLVRFGVHFNYSNSIHRGAFRS